MMPNHCRSVLLLVVLTACAKPDLVEPLRAETAALVPYYRDTLDGLQRRYDRIVARGWALRSPVPGADHAGAQLKAAGQTMAEMRGLVGAGRVTAPLAKQVEQIAQAGDSDGLERLYTSSSAKLERGAVEVNEHLTDVESWLVSAEATIKLQPPPAERAMLAP